MLGPKQNFYGIQVPTNKRNNEFARSIKEMSRYYVDESVKFQPNRALLLGGYSIGATIALEMSHQLIARGREVSLLVVFDGELFNTGAEISSRNPLYWLKLLLNMRRWIVDELMKNPGRFASTPLRFLSVKVRQETIHAMERFIISMAICLITPPSLKLFTIVTTIMFRTAMLVAFWCSS
jgi:hypothetical protein